MDKVFIVHGPAGCGKTHYREEIAEFLTGNRTAYHDDEFHIGDIQAGTVYLMQDTGRGQDIIDRFDGEVEIHAFAALKPRIWRPMNEAPTDGTLFDAVRDGIRFTDCHIDEQGRHCKKHGYPATTRVFLKPLDGWAPRPGGLLQPYETAESGEKYVPQCETLFKSA